MVGGGIIGLSIAWRLAQRGAEVRVFDGGDRGAWFVAAGMLAVGTESTWESRELGELMTASARLWPGFADELGVDLPRAGTLTVALTADDVAQSSREWARQDALKSERERAPQDVVKPERERAPQDAVKPERERAPQDAVKPERERARPDAIRPEPEWARQDIERLTPSALRELEPALSPRVRAGSRRPGDVQVDPRKIVAALRARVNVVSKRIDDPASLDADRVIVAAGTGTAALTGLPVRPVKGELLRLRGEPGLIRHVISGYADGRHVYLVPRADGEVVVGATQEERTDHAVTAGAVLDLLRAAIDLVPALADFEITETLAGHRPSTPDNAPLLGRLDERTVVAAGHHRNGVLLAPITAALIAELVLTGEADPRLAPFAPGRFA